MCLSTGLSYFLGPPLDWRDPTIGPGHFWFATLDIVSTELNLGLNFSHWELHKRPLLGLFPKNKDAARTNYTASYQPTYTV